MKVLITGGAGFIGSHLANLHLAKKDDVWVVDSCYRKEPTNIEPIRSHPHFRFSRDDLHAWNELDEAVNWADQIYHLAAILGQEYVLNHPYEVITQNITSLDRLLDAMIRLGSKSPLLITSSSEVYPKSVLEPFTESLELTFSSNNIHQEVYPASKYINELSALSAFREKGINVIVARLFNTIGINQSLEYGAVVPVFTQEAKDNRPLTIFGDGLQTRSFCDVRDTVALLDKLCQNKDAIGQVVNVGNDAEITIKALAEQVKAIANSSSELTYIPYQEAYGMEYTDVKRRKPDLSLVRQLTAHQHEYTLDESIQTILETL